MAKSKSHLALIFRLLSIVAVFLLAPLTGAPAQNSERPVAQGYMLAQQQQLQHIQRARRPTTTTTTTTRHRRGVGGHAITTTRTTVKQPPIRVLERRLGQPPIRVLERRLGQPPVRVLERPLGQPRIPVEVARPGTCAICGRAGSCEIWLGSVRRSPVPFDGRGGFYIGLVYYWPQGCFQISRPYCHGITPDGCTLSWQDVELVGGGTVAQCVQLCPRPGVAPPVAACPPCISPAVVPGGVCTVDIFAETNFAGDTAELHENMPTIGDWNRDISSIQVKAGTWDFFTEPDYKGEVMRLTPGEYRELGAKWDNQIGSFMCVDQ